MSDASPPILTDIERRDRLRLIRTENVGPVTFRRLIEVYGSAGRALAALPDLARRGAGRGGAALRVCPIADALREIDAIARIGGALLVLGDAEYPSALAAIDDAPASLTVLGDVGRLFQPSIAIVGSRNASINGRTIAERLARDLGAGGLVVVSGMARGIDSAAHRGAHASGTIAVLAGGADVVYPPENADLHRAIIERGAIVAELPPGVQPQARHFPRRNRIIAGLVRGVIVVEAGLRSGSLITARLALEQGRDVFAVPGSPLDPRARGGNDLIRQGAVLTEDAADVFDEWRGQPPSGAPRPPIQRQEPSQEAGDPPDDARRTLEELLSPEPVSVDELLRSCQLSPAVMTTLLLEWELAGRLERHPGNRVSRIGSRL